MDNIVLPDSFDGRVVWDGLLKNFPIHKGSVEVIVLYLALLC